jgi:hypothetical protein
MASRRPKNLQKQRDGLHRLFGPAPEPPRPPRRSWWVGQPADGFTSKAVAEVRQDGVRVPFPDTHDPGRGGW